MGRPLDSVRAQILPANTIHGYWYRGGNTLAEWRGLPFAGFDAPEEWLGSTVSRFGIPGAGPSLLADGRLVVDAITDDPTAWMGTSDGQPGDSGMLVKLLDAGQRLPVHVHPTREFAVTHLDCPYGKTEAWYVLETQGDAAVWIGWREDVDPAVLNDLIDSQDAESMLALMNRIPVKPGDGILVPGGTPHAIGAGVFLLEVQEPVDQSVLMEHVNTSTTEEQRFIGLERSLALSALNMVALPDPDSLCRTVPSDAVGLRAVLPPEADPFFLMHQVTAGGAVPAAFAVGIVLDGEGELVPENGDPLPLVPRQPFIVPAAAGSWHVTGKVRLIVCRPGTSWPPRLVA
ncbi:phosphoheptose isomerase [Gulosibacter molinativorax]|uniref:Phosphoheptose isomerase n=2 Tax=Gulosibacter molinativorax TaxID=256821 RepID=A0ABT7C4V3_9MICO|nr:phosphoheptose isomerase [Gulosibacter molinativorax]